MAICTQDKSVPMHVYIQTVRDLQAAAGSHTDIQTTIVFIRATQRHFQVLSNNEADMFFTLSTSPLSVEQIHTHNQIPCSTSLKCSTDSLRHHVNNYL